MFKNLQCQSSYRLISTSAKHLSIKDHHSTDHYVSNNEPLVRQSDFLLKELVYFIIN